MILKKLWEIVDSSSQDNSSNNNNKENIAGNITYNGMLHKKRQFFDAKPIVDGFKEIVDQTERKEFKTILQCKFNTKGN